MASGSNAPFSGNHADLENVDSGQHHTKVTPDGSTIVTDSNGDLKAQVKSTTLIGDFESSFGSWSKSTSGFGTVQRQNNGDGAESTSTFIELRSPDSSLARLDADFDLTGFSELVLFKRVSVRDTDNCTFEVNVDFQTLFSQSGNFPTDSTYKKIVIDISNFSGQQNIQIETAAGSPSVSSVVVDVDRIKLKSPGASGAFTVNPGAGN